MPDFDAPSEYLRANYEREDWLAVVLIYRNPASLKQKFATAEKIATPQYQAHLRAANANGADVYLTVNSLKPGATGRKRAHVDAVRHVFLDLDGRGKQAVNRVLKAEGMPNPHHVLNTSPDKHQMIWSVERFENDQAEDLVRGMASKFDADEAVWDIARVLRMPSFRNHKYQELRHFVKDVHENPPMARAYGPERFPKLLVKRDRQTAFDETKSHAVAGNGSQSERGWAYVMRELAHGVDPLALFSGLASINAAGLPRELGKIWPPRVLQSTYCRLYGQVTFQKRTPRLRWSVDALAVGSPFLLTLNLQHKRDSRRKSQKVSKGPEDDHYAFPEAFRRWVKK